MSVPTLIRPPITTRDLADLRRTISHLKSDMALRAAGRRTIHVVDFFLLFIYYIERDWHPDFGPVEYLFDNAIDGQFLLVPPSLLEMERVTDIIGSRLDLISKRETALVTFASSDLAREFTTAVAAAIDNEQPVYRAWGAYRDLRRAGRERVDDISFLARFRSTYIAPIQAMCRDLRESDRFLREASIAQALDVETILPHKDTYLSALRDMASWRPDRHGSNTTDALVYAMTAALNERSATIGAGFYFRNVTGRLTADVMSRVTAPTCFREIAEVEDWSLCRDVRAVLLEAQSIADSVQSPGGLGGIWDSWLATLDELLALEVERRAARGERRGKRVLRRAELMRWVVDRSTRRLLDATCTRSGALESVAVDSEFSEPDITDLRSVDLRVEGEVKQIGDLIGRIASGEDRIGDLAKAFREQFASVLGQIAATVKEMSTERSLDRYKRDFADALAEVKKLGNPLISLKAALEVVQAGLMKKKPSEDLDAACEIVRKRLDQVGSRDQSRALALMEQSIQEAARRRRWDVAQMLETRMESWRVGRHVSR